MKKPLREQPFFVEGLLFLATFFWGMSFLWCKDISNSGVDVNAYVAIRYFIATLLLLPIAWKDLRQATKKDVFNCIVMGVLYYFCQTLQVWGMNYTTPANGSFITAAYVVMVPLTSWILLKRKPEKTIWISIVLCVAGLYVLNFAKGEGLQLNIGNVITFGCAICWAIQMSFISYAGQTTKTTVLTSLPLFFAACIAATVAAVTGKFNMTGTDMPFFFKTVILLVLFPTIGSGLAQSYAQKYVAPTKASIIYTTESLIAFVGSVLLGYDVVSARLVIGGLLIVSGVFLVDFKFPFKKKKEGEIV